jgi:nucleoside 2-deoxyribosyltransferase
MKIALIGSTQYQSKFQVEAARLRSLGHTVRSPAFDDHPEMDELMLCEHNRSMIEWADWVYIIWDARSIGTIFDFGMVFALRKPVHVLYMEKKTVAGMMKKYSDCCPKAPGPEPTAQPTERR